MEEEEVRFGQTSATAGSQPQNKASGDRVLLLGLVPEPGKAVPSSPSPSPSSPPPPGSAVHALRSKVKALSQRPCGRERKREKMREEKRTSELHAGRLASSQALTRQKCRSRGEVLPPVLSRHYDLRRQSSSSEDEVEEVVASVQLHSHPTELEREQEDWGATGGLDRSVPVQPRGLGEGASLESLDNIQSDSTRENKDGTPSSTKPTPSSSSTSSPSSTSSHRHWAPPRGFWRVARPETLILNGVDPQSAGVTPSTVSTSSSPGPPKDETPAGDNLSGPERKPRRFSADSAEEDQDESGSRWNMLRSDSLDCYIERCDKKKDEEPVDPPAGLRRAESWESVCSQDGALSLEETVAANRKARGLPASGRRNGDRGREKDVVDIPSLCVDLVDQTDASLNPSSSRDPEVDLTTPQQERLELPKSHLNPDELPLSPRHEQAMVLLERARLKARSNCAKGERPPTRRAHSAQRYNTRQHHVSNSPPIQKDVAEKAEEEATAPHPSSGPLLVPPNRGPSPVGRTRLYANSPTRVWFEDESEKEVESRYLNRVKERGRATAHKAKEKSRGMQGKNSDPTISIAGLAPPLEDAGFTSAASTQTAEVGVRKCEACGSILRDPPVPKPETAQSQPGDVDESQGKKVPRWVPPGHSDGISEPDQPSIIRPKAAGVTFGGVLILGEDREERAERGPGDRTSGFGKLRRRSRKGENRLKRVGSGHGPYGASWAHRRNSNPRNRVNVCRRAVTFALGSPVALERPQVEGSGNSTSPLPIKSALKSSSKNRAGGQRGVKPSAQYRLVSVDDGPGGSPQYHEHLNAEQHGEGAVSTPSGTPSSPDLVPCIRPSSLRYAPARVNPDHPAADLWDTAVDGAGVALSGDTCRDLPAGLPEYRSSLRCLAVSRAEDLRAELLRAEHLKAEAQWEEGLEGARRTMAERDGRPKLSLRRFFSSIGLHSVGRLVKGGRSSSMEQLSVSASRVSSASPSPTRRPTSDTGLQRTPSLQALNTVSPLAQLRKASSVQSLERRAERPTILGGMPVSYSLSPRGVQRALSVENMLATRVLGPVGPVGPAGRVVQAFPDGTLLLELTRPANGPFGFVISRGKGRPVTGVYMEQVGDGAEEGLYSGLLGVGDELLEVNGEAVAGLTLDQVTRLMTRDSTATIRVLPHRRNGHAGTPR
ncbi:uncharacterized protein si:ch211-13f8.1 isoform X2 [Esox lucius]|uniref:uncharacterized protein si:ch211-13f8.1 isoform X2 n=1 Tax=Esox lucius TaxID=8010 RepID=UPI001476F8A5|nr:uncharacterized protein si:ch211-13f8.1 isoform X2 [Esox lucius]